MTNHPRPTLPPFAPVPAVPIVIMTHSKGQCVVRVAGAAASGATLREAVEAAIYLHAQKEP